MLDEEEYEHVFIANVQDKKGTQVCEECYDEMPISQTANQDRIEIPRCPSCGHWAVALTSDSHTPVCQECLEEEDGTSAAPLCAVCLQENKLKASVYLPRVKGGLSTCRAHC